MAAKDGVEVPAGGVPRLPGDEDRPGTRQTGEQVCPTCGGSGRIVAIVGDA